MKSRTKRIAAYAIGLTIWYSAIPGPSPQDKNAVKYPLEQKIEVIGGEYNTINGEHKIIGNGTNEINHTGPNIILNTDSVDFSSDFLIKTERYNLSKDEDFWISRQIGWALSIPEKLFLWDSDISSGVDEKKAKETLAILEQNKNIKDLTVRLNHNEVWEDLYRLFADDKVTQRNNIIARVGLGVPSILLSELTAEIGRSSYYNPLTQTVVNYSNIESIITHEVGHHKDYQRFDSDWLYSLTSSIPGGFLYKEYQASKNASILMSKEDQWQVLRYLAPAYSTYVLATYYMLKKWKRIAKNIMKHF